MSYYTTASKTKVRHVRKIQNNGILEKFRICEPSRASSNLPARLSFHKIADLAKESRVFDAGFY